MQIDNSVNRIEDIVVEQEEPLAEELGVGDEPGDDFDKVVVEEELARVVLVAVQSDKAPKLRHRQDLTEKQLVNRQSLPIEVVDQR